MTPFEAGKGSGSDKDPLYRILTLFRPSNHGSSSYDSNQAALVALLAEWTSNHDYATRIANLTDTGTGLLSRLNANYFLLDSGSGQTVFNDSSSDTLTGSTGSDWFFAGTADKVTDLSTLDQAFIFGL